MSTLFTKIINGEIPSYKIYEDDLTFAFLDINPEAPGHTLVVPKTEVDKLYDLDNKYYSAVMSTVKKLAKHYEKVLGRRILIKVVGVDVPHAHVHLIPINSSDNPEAKTATNSTPEALAEMQHKLKLDN